MKFSFDPETHSYFYGKTRLLSVTQVLEGVGLVRGKPYFREEHRQRGHNVHLATRYADEGTLDRDALSSRIKGYVTSWETFRQDKEFEPILIEEPMYMPDEGWAGTPDRIGLMDGEWWVIDFKSGHFSKEHLVQVKAYSILAKERLGVDVCRSAIVVLDANGGPPKFRVARVIHRSVWYAALTLYKFQKGA